MTDDISPIIQASELLALYPSENLVLVDVSTGKDARANYDKNHLDGALFADMNTQLASIKEDPSDGGRHPLPGIKQFSGTLSKLGISPTSHVVIYDDNNGSNAAARFWWMLKSAGHHKVQVLNGGFKTAADAGFPTNAKIVTPAPSEPYKFENWKLPLSDMAEVETVSHDPNYIIIDVRDKERFDGEKEPIDLIAGHIPGAINVPYTTNLDEQGRFLPPAELKTRYQNLFKNKKTNNIIVHCGSGVTACHTLLSIAYAGLEIPKLYVGSWSEWSRNNKPMVTKNNAG